MSHEYGLGAQYDEELRWIDHLVATPARGAARPAPRSPSPPTTARWRPATTCSSCRATCSPTWPCRAARAGSAGCTPAPAAAGALADAAASLLGDHAWVRTREQAIDEGWYGPKVTDAAAGRLGDVLLAAKGTVAFHDPKDTGPYVLVGRHGSLTPDEMLVPLLAGVAGA